MSPVWGTPADELYNKGVTNLQAEKYDDAAAAFVQLIAGYPTGAHVDDAHISAGFAYLHASKYPEAIDVLSSLATNTMPEKASYKATALYFTALAQFSMGQSDAKTDKAKGAADFQAAVTTLTTLINICTTAPTADNKGYLEQAIYYRALSQYLREDYDDAEKDLLQLIKQFPNSLSKPDYWLRLGSAYAVETNNAVSGKKSTDEIVAQAQKAIDAFDQVSKDPNALVQANDANMSKGEILFMIAQLDPDSSAAGYQKALDAYRLVRRRDDMIPLQQQRIDELKRQVAAMLQSTTGSAMASYSNDAALLIGREETRLEDLKTGPDPIVLALIRMAECYVNMKQPNEARTILHRLSHAQLTADQQQEVDFQTLYSYVLGGQTDKADKALTDYLGKHADDPQADSISYQIAGKLQERKDYDGALKQELRSMKDFPKGKFADDALILEASTLTSLNRIDESNKIVEEYLKANPTSPKANNLLITRGQIESSRKDYAAALADFQKVKDNSAATPELRGAADASYIQTLSKMQRFDELIAEAKKFAAQYKDSKALPSVMLFSALALSEKKDPGAVAALQNVAKTYPTDDAAPFALFSIVNLYAQANNVPGMIQAATDLRTAFPQAYPMLIQTADVVSTILVKQKKYDDAIALYQPLADAPKPDIAATSRNKIGTLWLEAAHEMHYQSLPPAMRPDAEKRLVSAEQSFVQVLKDFPDQIGAVGDAIEGLGAVAKQRHSWGLLKDTAPDLEKYLTDVTAPVATPEIQQRVEMAKAGLALMVKNGASQFPAALDRFKKAIAANPALVLNRQESDQLGQLAIATGDFDTAQKTYSDLLANATANDQTSRGYAYYGLGATLLAQGKVLEAKDYFLKLKALPGGGLWHPHIDDANYGIALADEQSTKTDDLVEAKNIYSALMQNPAGGPVRQAKAMLGFGRLLEKAGFAIKPAPTGPTEYAVHYYQEPGLLYAISVPEQSAEGLYDAGQAYEKAGDKVSAKKQYDDLLKTYGTLAPDWAAKARDPEGKLGP
jgi:tetratricopeptide (TPR) repeat protein